MGLHSDRCTVDLFAIRPPVWGEGRARGRVWYPVKLLRIRYNFFAGTEVLSLSVYEPIAKQIFHGGPSPNLGEGSSWGQVWYTVKVLHIRYNLFAGTEMLLSPFTSQ